MAKSKTVKIKRHKVPHYWRQKSQRRDTPSTYGFGWNGRLKKQERPTVSKSQ